MFYILQASHLCLMIGFKDNTICIPSYKANLYLNNPNYVRMIDNAYSI